MTRYRCVDDQKAAGFPVRAACEAAGVSTSGFYDWHTREAAGPTDRQVAEAELVERMSEIFEASDGNYGVPRMYKELRRGGLVVPVLEGGILRFEEHASGRVVSVVTAVDGERLNGYWIRAVEAVDAGAGT